MNPESILVTGGSGMVGSALQEIIPEAIFLSSRDCDLRAIDEVEQLFERYKPEYIIHLAARVGGVKANMSYLGDFYYDNILINTNVLQAAHQHQVKKVISVLSTCVYPDKVSYPLTEEQIHLGPPHSSNFAYAYAKRMLDVQSRAYRMQHGCNFITAVPNNLYGPHDNFHLEDSHVIPALIRKIWEAKKTATTPELWGDGTPLREFTYSGDIAKILIFLLENYNDEYPINIGNTEEITISKVAEKISYNLEHTHGLRWDITKPSGQYKKPSNNDKLLNLGWQRSNYTDFSTGLKTMCDWFIENYPNVRGSNEK